MAVSLADAVAATRTGDIWLFRGRSVPDRAIQLTTNSPVNHVGMALVIDDLPPLLWHAELGKSLPSQWSGKHQRGAQLHDLAAAVEVWRTKYGQRAWFRQLDPPATREMENAALRTVARLDGTPFPSTAQLAWRWARGRVRGRLGPLGRLDRLGGKLGRLTRREQAALETAYCAEVVAVTYQAMGLLPAGTRPPSWYDPGTFWSGDRLDLQGGYRLGDEIAIDP
ncbi:MAG TPA: hypothetical protein VIL37_19970 [Natronosporangium sp.]